MLHSTNNNDAEENDLIKYLPLTQEYLTKTLNLINEIYFKHEHISTLLGLDKSPEDIKELSEKYVMHMINQEISYIAVEKATEDVIGCQINILAVKSDHKQSFYSCINVKNPIAKAYVDINVQLDEAAHPFQLLNTNCYMEPVIAVVVPKYRKSGVLKMLCTMTMGTAKSLSQGEYVKVPLTDKPSADLSLQQPIPTAVIVYSTAVAITKSAEKLGFKAIYEFDIHKLNYFKHKSLDVLKVDVLFKNINDNKNVQ